MTTQPIQVPPPHPSAHQPRCAECRRFVRIEDLLPARRVTVGAWGVTMAPVCGRCGDKEKP